MKAYELMYITKTAEIVEQDEEKAADIAVKYSELIADYNGLCEKIDFWGRKRLAYEINDKEEALYTLITFVASPELIRELDRKLQLDEEVLRHLIMSKGC